MPKTKFSKGVLEAALVGFQEKKREIDAKIAELQAILAATSESPKRLKARPRKLSDEGRRRITAATKQRWRAARKGATVAKKSKTNGTSGTGPRVGREAEIE